MGRVWNFVGWASAAYAAAHVAVWAFKRPQNIQRVFEIQIADGTAPVFVHGDHLVGRHRLKLQSMTVDGEDWLVGCVPCYSMWTTVAFKDDKMYALNGLTRPLYRRMQFFEKGKMTPLADCETLDPGKCGQLISAAQSDPMCWVPVDDILQRANRARAFGECLAGWP